MILSGGSGTRLWPLSRKFYPKQLLLPENGEHSLLQSTALRLDHLESPIIVCNEEHRFMVAEQLLDVECEPAAIIVEPIGRNTAPAIAVAAIHALSQNENAIIAVFPADHMIGDQKPFCNAIETAVDTAKDDFLVTLGVVPSRAETGYGYIKAEFNDCKARPVEHFVEKPNEEQAKKYLESGAYFWNSGIFIFKASAYLNALNKFDEKIYHSCQTAMLDSNKDTVFIHLNKSAFEDCPSNSIDYAVIEKSSNVMVVPMLSDWNDLGSWGSLWDIAEKDVNNNVVNQDTITLETENTLSLSYKNKVVALVGLNNLVVIDTKDALLVANRDNVEQVKDVVAQLSNQNRSEHLLHREVHRPWGSYESLDVGKRYQVKHIKVKPGASLSLQMHHHRAEHWVVVTGCAIVQIAEEERLLTENQSVYIPIGEKHRLTNPGKLTLELIEVQSGTYLGEDDITRFEDIYERS